MMAMAMPINFSIPVMNVATQQSIPAMRFMMLALMWTRNILRMMEQLKVQKQICRRFQVYDWACRQLSLRQMWTNGNRDKTGKLGYEVDQIYQENRRLLSHEVQRRRVVLIE
jgi:hypothetical protein